MRCRGELVWFEELMQETSVRWNSDLQALHDHQRKRWKETNTETEGEKKETCVFWEGLTTEAWYGKVWSVWTVSYVYLLSLCVSLVQWLIVLRLHGVLDLMRLEDQWGRLTQRNWLMRRRSKSAFKGGDEATARGAYVCVRTIYWMAFWQLEELGVMTDAEAITEAAESMLGS